MAAPKCLGNNHAAAGGARHATGAPDLQAIFARLNATYFHGLCQADIGWARRTAPRGRSRRSIWLGSYTPAQRRIRIHPLLGDVCVPLLVVELVVFHEMLHEVFDASAQKGRRRWHPPEFVAVEQSHPDYAAARAWEQAHLPRLLKQRA